MARIKPQALLLQSKKKKVPARVAIPTLITALAVVALLFFSALLLHRHKAKREHDHANSQLDFFEKKDVFHFGGRQKITKMPRFAVLNTTKGAISVQLSVQGALKTVEHFVKYSQSGYYNGLQFHRVIKHYMIQGGDLENGGTREEWTQPGHLNDELEASLKHEPFMLATSKTYPDTSGFELYITTTAIPHLDDKLLVFGQVVRGEAVVQEIEEVDTDEHFRPKFPDSLSTEARASLFISRKGGVQDHLEAFFNMKDSQCALPNGPRKEAYGSWQMHRCTGS